MILAARRSACFCAGVMASLSVFEGKSLDFSSAVLDDVEEVVSMEAESADLVELLEEKMLEGMVIDGSLISKMV